jgi:predicted nucleic acid-binding protein
VAGRRATLAVQLGLAAAPNLVVDASVGADLLARTSRARAVGARLRGSVWHAPGHLDAEVLSALGRLERAGKLDAVEAAEGLVALSELPIERHAVSPLLLGAWTLRNELRLVDGLYVELARQLGMRLITSDQRPARAAGPIAESIS